MRWIEGMTSAASRLVGARSRINVSDRESDFYPLLARVPEGNDLVIRARHDRQLADGGALFAAADAWPDLGVAEIRRRRAPGRQGPHGQRAIRAVRIRLRSPRHRAHSRS